MADLYDIAITFAPDSYRLNHSASPSWSPSSSARSHFPALQTAASHLRGRLAPETEALIEELPASPISRPVRRQ